MTIRREASIKSADLAISHKSSLLDTEPYPPNKQVNSITNNSINKIFIIVLISLLAFAGLFLSDIKAFGDFKGFVCLDAATVIFAITC